MPSIAMGQLRPGLEVASQARDILLAQRAEPTDVHVVLQVGDFHPTGEVVRRDARAVSVTANTHRASGGRISSKQRVCRGGWHSAVEGMRSMRLSVALVALALVLSACAVTPSTVPAAPGGAAAPAPQSAGPVQAAPAQQAVPQPAPAAGAPAQAAQPAAPAVSAGSQPPPAKPADVPPRKRADSYTPGQPTLIFFDADG